MDKLIGKDVKVTFLDHAKDDTKPCKCTVRGIIKDIVEKENGKALLIVYWDLPDPEDIADRAENQETLVILSSTIIELEEVIEYKKIKLKGVKNGRTGKAKKSSKSS